MIFTTIAALMFQILNVAVFWADPVTSLPFNMVENLTAVYGLVHSAVRFFPPLGSAMLFLIFGLGLEVAYFSYSIAMTIVRFVISLK